MDYKLITNIKFGGIYHDDYPEYCEAYIASAQYNGRPMTDEELEIINEDRNFVHEQLILYLH